MSPAQMRRLAVAELAREQIAACPWPLREAFETVIVQVKEVVDQEDLDRGATATMPGYYYAAEDLSEDGCEDRLPPLPGVDPVPRIVLIAANLEITRAAVGVVLMHEMGHHLGFDEFELTEGLGLR